jgi:hypothetical protein
MSHYYRKIREEGEGINTRGSREKRHRKKTNTENTEDTEVHRGRIWVGIA